MKKILFVFAFSVVFALLSVQNSLAAGATSACDLNSCTLQDASVAAENAKIEQTKKDITKFVKNFEQKQNAHNILVLKKMYADDFTNTDGYNKEQLFNLLQKTFGGYPNIKTIITISNIELFDNYAMVFLKQNVTATTKVASKITGDKGEYTATMYSIMYLKKTNNNNWIIYSEDVVSENSKLAYGTAKNINAKINSPQKVIANSDYSAGISIDVPVGFSAIASINNTQMVQGYNLSGETFRQVPPDDTNLERILKSNNLANNEAVVVSIGFTQTSQDIFKNPKVDISGLMMLLQRVDIIPANSNNKKDLSCAKK